MGPFGPHIVSNGTNTGQKITLSGIPDDFTWIQIHRRRGTISSDYTRIGGLIGALAWTGWHHGDGTIEMSVGGSALTATNSASNDVWYVLVYTHLSGVRHEFAVHELFGDRVGNTGANIATGAMSATGVAILVDPGGTSSDMIGDVLLVDVLRGVPYEAKDLAARLAGDPFGAFRRTYRFDFPVTAPITDTIYPQINWW